MFKAVALVLLSMVLVGDVASAQGDSVCPCYIGDSFNSLTPAGALILARPGNESENVIEVSQPSFVSHGWQMDAGCGGATAEEMCSFVRDHLRFELEVNGQIVEPSFITIWEHSAQTACPLQPERTVWGAVWTFEFDANHFAPGIHILKGYWSVVEFPYACAACDILEADAALMEDCRNCGIALIERLMAQGWPGVEWNLGENVYGQSHTKTSELTVLWPSQP